MKKTLYVAREWATPFCLLLVMFACLAVLVGLDRSKSARARASADAYTAGNNWTLVRTDRGKAGDYYLVYVRSDDAALGEQQIVVFPDDETGAQLLSLRPSDRFAFKRTAGHSFRMRAFDTNYLAVAPAS